MMRYLLLLLLLLTGCEDKYRYYCQNPDNFHAEQCQKPRCQFTQTCPEYLVAPILEKQIDQQQQPKPANTDKAKP
jgi:hypothetical protein